MERKINKNMLKISIVTKFETFNGIKIKLHARSIFNMKFAESAMTSTIFYTLIKTVKSSGRCCTIMCTHHHLHQCLDKLQEKSHGKHACREPRSRKKLGESERGKVSSAENTVKSPSSLPLPCVFRAKSTRGGAKKMSGRKQGGAPRGTERSRRKKKANVRTKSKTERRRKRERRSFFHARTAHALFLRARTRHVKRSKKRRTC